MKIIKGSIVLAFMMAFLYFLTGTSFANTTVTGTVYDSGQNLANKVWLRLDSNTNSYNVWVTNGMFSIYLPDGQYNVEDYWDESTQNYVHLQNTFTVTGSVYTPSPIVIGVPSKNVSGTLSKGTVPVNNVWLQLYDSTTRKDYKTKVSNGNFNLYLPDGSYQMQGYIDPNSQEYVDMTKLQNNSFSVTKSVYSPSPLNFVIPSENVAGSLVGVNTTINVNGILSMHSTDTQKWYDTKIINNNFSLYLPNGNYQIDGYWDQSLKEYVQLNQTFAVSGGTPSINPLKINVMGKNVSGTLKDAQGNNINNVWLSMHLQDNSTWKNYKAIAKNGAFSLYLPDGTYVIDGYWDDTVHKEINLNQTFTVSGGSLVNFPLDVVVYADNVNGVFQSSTTITKGSIDIVSSDGTKWYHTDILNNQFSLYLPDGQYKVNGYWDNTSKEYSQIEYSFSVAGAVTTPSPLTIKIPDKNVTGTLKKDNGAAIQQAWMYIQDTDSIQSKGYNVLVTNGNFSLYLPDGQYAVRGYWDEATKKFTSLKVLFTVAGGVSTPSQLAVTVLSDNISGTLQSTQAITDGNLNLHSTDQDQQWYNAQIKNGSFSLYLPDGSYKVDGYFDAVTQEYNAIDYSFTVVNGQSTPNPLLIAIHDKNVAGTLTKTDGTSIDGVWMHMYSQNSAKTEWHDYKTQVKNGKFSLYLPDGKYVIDGYWDDINKENVSLQYSFTVTNGNSDPNPLQVVVHDKNVFGTLQSNPTVIKGNINIHTSGTQKQQWYNAEISNGSFGLYLPDGTYAIDGFWNQDTQEYIQLNQKFTVTNGVSSPNPIQIMVHDKNVFGTLKRPNGENLNQVNLNIQSTGQEQNYYSAGVNDGQFGVYLPDGDYQINGYWDNEQQTNIPLNYSFKVVNGVSDPNPLTIVVPVANVSGTLKNQDGTAVVGPVDMGIQSTNSNYFANITVKDGKFELFLPDGDYQARSYYDPSKNTEVSLDYTFTVANGKPTEPVNIMVPVQNVSGVLKWDTGDIPQGKIELEIMGQTAAGNFYYTNTLVNNNGQFSLTMPDGTYNINYMNHDTGDVANLEYPFTITNGVTNPSLLSPVIHTPNIQGSITKEGSSTALDNVTLNITTSSGERYITSIHNGSFAIYLPDGDYHATSYSDNMTHEEYQFDFAFSIASGVPNPNPLNIVVPKPNVMGTLKNSNGTNVAGPAYMNIQSTSSNFYTNVQVINGQFQTYLPDGDYVAKDYMDKMTGEDIFLNYSFTVSNGSPTSPVNIVVPTQNVTGTLKWDNGNIPQGKTELEFMGQTADGKFYYTNTLVNNNGQFSLVMPDGTYTISYMSIDTGDVANLQYSFTITNGVTNPSILNPIIHTTNIQGTITQDGSSTALDNATLNVLDSSGKQYIASIHNGSFAIYLPDGDYHVDAYSDNLTGLDYHFDYSFSVTNGIPSSNPLNIVAPKPNVSGTILDDAGNVPAGKKLMLDFKGQKTDGSPYYASARLNDQGQFQLFLPDGSYSVVLRNDETNVESNLDTTFNVSSGVSNPSTLNLVLHTPNVAGTLKNSNGTLINDNVILSFDVLTSNGNGGFNEQYYTSLATASGQFSVYLPTGTYKVTGYDDKQTGQHIDLNSANITVTVSSQGQPNPSSLDIVAPTP